MTQKFGLQILAVAACAVFMQQAICAEITPYVRAIPQSKSPPRSDVGFNFFADSLNLQGAITTRRAGTTTLVTPQLASSFALAPDLKFETRATFTNWNQPTGTQRDAVESRLTARSTLPMLAEIEGSVGHNAAGESRRKLRLKMNDATVASFQSEPIKLMTNATIEQVGKGTAPSTLVTGVEAALVQQASPASALNRLGFKYTNQTGAIDKQLQAATFSRSWLHNDALRLGVEYQLTRDVTNLQNALRFTWQGYF